MRLFCRGGKREQFWDWLLSLQRYSENDVVDWANQLLDALEFLHGFWSCLHDFDVCCLFFFLLYHAKLSLICSSITYLSCIKTTTRKCYKSIEELMPVRKNDEADLDAPLGCPPS